MSDSDTTPVQPFWKRQLLAFSTISSAKVDGVISFFKKVADYLVTLLRLFAVLIVSLILTFIVLEVWRSSNLVVVKPFTLPKSMQDLNPDGGRIIANQLSREMKDAENQLYCTIKVGSENGQRCSSGSGNLQSIISRDADSFLVGGNIKLPETGISINDVVEFISRMFGRRNIVGSIYEDNGGLFLQIELDGTVFKTSRVLDCNRALSGGLEGSSVAEGGCDPSAQDAGKGMKREGELNYDLINSMLKESSIVMLSAASANHNVFYFCAGQTDVDVHRDEPGVSEWFQYCSHLRDNQLSGDELGSILHALEEKQVVMAGKSGTENELIASVRDLIYNNALAKTAILCPGYQKGQDCVLPTVADDKPAVMQASQSGRLLIPPPEPLNPSVMTGMEGVAGGSRYPSGVSAVNLSPANNNLVAVKRQWDSCVGTRGGSPRPPANSRETLDSNTADGAGTQAFNNKLYQQALDAYTRALDINCRNAYAWANIGVLFNQQKDTEAAVFALERSTLLNPDIDWSQNSLCIARAYALPLGRMEQGLSDDSCKKARDINPLNKVAMDKRFYLAVAERYAEANNYDKALVAYQKVLSVDNKLDCNTRDVFAGLTVLGERQGRTAETNTVICKIKEKAIPLPGGKPSQCATDLDKYCSN